MGQLWTCNTDLALVLAASMPSGCSSVVDIRSEIISICGLSAAQVRRPRALPTCHSLQSLSFPVKSGFCYGFVYIGSGFAIVDVEASPWGSPFGCIASASDELSFQDFAVSRADAEVWLAPLVGMKLVCDCCQRDQSKTSHCKIIANLYHGYV